MTSTTDLIDSAIWSLSLNDKIKLWKLIEKLVEENRTEISDEEIKEMANESKSIFKEDMYRTYFIMGAKWYREQLKQRQ